MKTYSLLLSTLLVLTCLSSSAQYESDGLKILDPRSSNYKVAAHFDKIKMAITPQGVFANVDIEMEVSSQNTTFSYLDSLEIEYKFTLPHGSHIHSAWLWMNDIPVEAQLYEKDHAQFIYESLVNRRVDPLIIYKNSNETYEARIFPVNRNEARKVKFSILIPINANNKVIDLPLPLSMFRCDQPSVTPNIEIQIKNNTFWGKPDVWPSALTVFEQPTETTFVLPSSKTNLNSIYSLLFSNKTASDLMIINPENANAGYYQLMLSPKDTAPGQHFIFAIDYKQNSKLSDAEIYNALKSKLLFELNEKDSFNIVYKKNGQVITASPSWLSATTATISQTMDNLTLTTANSDNMNYQVILKCIEFNNMNLNKGSILLITNSNSQYNSAQECNTRLNLLQTNMPIVYPINVLHVGTTFEYDFYTQASNTTWYNNDYFLSNLVSMTGGHFNKRLLNEIPFYESSYRSLGDALSIAINNIMPNYTLFDVNYTFAGILSNRYKLPKLPIAKQRRTYFEVGRYFGQGPVTINKFYNADTTLHSESYLLNPEIDSNGLTKKMWAGSYLQDLTDANSNGTYSSIIVNNSIEYHVLSEYTAFLALEPDTIVKPVNNHGPSKITEHTGTIGMTISAAPNPFYDVQNLVVDPKDLYPNSQWELKITDVYGRIVFIKNGITSNDKKLTITWNGSQLTKGIYIATIKIGNKIGVIKIVKQ